MRGYAPRPAPKTRVRRVSAGVRNWTRASSLLRSPSLKHYDGRQLTVFGKGGKVRYLPVIERELREALERHILERAPETQIGGVCLKRGAGDPWGLTKLRVLGVSWTQLAVRPRGGGTATSQGRPYAIFRRVLEHGNLDLARRRLPICKPHERGVRSIGLVANASSAAETAGERETPARRLNPRGRRYATTSPLSRPRSADRARRRWQYGRGCSRSNIPLPCQWFVRGGAVGDKQVARSPRRSSIPSRTRTA
jgi:hypothetical protein